MSEDRKSLSPEPGLSVSVKFAVAVGVALIALSSMVGIRLSQRARGYLIESRMYGATMVVELLTTTLEPVLDFGDKNDIAAELSRLQASADISYVGGWPQGAKTPAPVYGMPIENDVWPAARRASTFLSNSEKSSWRLPSGSSVRRGVTVPPLDEMALIFHASISD